jgi:hypothetical protein
MFFYTIIGRWPREVMRQTLKKKTMGRQSTAPPHTSDLGNPQPSQDRKQRSRAEIKARKSEILQERTRLADEYNTLVLEGYLLSDDEQRFEEKVESHPRQKFQRKAHPLDGALVGRIHWVEEFTDEGTGDKFLVDRQRVVRVNGVWV